MSASAPALEYSFPVDVTQLPAKGRDYTLTAKDDDRKRVAERLGLLELPVLTARITLTPAGSGIITVTGELQAEVVQSCVVSLVPVKSSIAESFSLGFSREPDEDEEGGELDLSPHEDPPELLTGDEIDLGELVVEQLALFIDPYPRAPGAVFQNPKKPGVETGKATISPFAALAKLKTQNKNN
ncbi:MAG: DUF177 domain-containing protein [Rhodospirillaceae bacterium]|nr:DUF177 domain-containing protein [Rhodospirillaceae bacterium]